MQSWATKMCLVITKVVRTLNLGFWIRALTKICSAVILAALLFDLLFEEMQSLGKVMRSATSRSR